MFGKNAVSLYTKQSTLDLRQDYFLISTGKRKTPKTYL